MRTQRISGLRRSLWLSGALVLIVLVGACGELRDTFTGDSSESATESGASDSAALGAASQTTYRIGETGGLGVSLRSDCTPDARVAGGWADSTEVQLVEVGAGRCAGWSLAEADGVESWVSDGYLVQTVSVAPGLESSTGDDGVTAASFPPSIGSLSSSGAPPMVVYGPAPMNASVVVLVDGQPCKTAETLAEPASATGQIWSAQVYPGECNAQNGSPITFTLNGAATNEQLAWSAAGLPPNATTGLRLTLQ